MAISPTPVQLRLLRFIGTYQASNDGRSPTRRVMADAIGLRHASGVQRHLEGLAERGHLRMLPGGVELLGPRSPHGEPLRFVALESCDG